MNSLLINSAVTLGGIGFVAASILFIASKKFKVFEDPRIDTFEDLLPSANCGACGYPGCRKFAEEIVKATDLEEFNCPVGGNRMMEEVAKVLGMEAVAQSPKVAVLRCNGTRQLAPQKVVFDGAPSCISAHNNFAGESGCAYGCLGLEDCVKVRKFDALYVDKETWLPVVIEDKCTACSACANICPRAIFEMRPKGKDGKRIYVACMNHEKGAEARKNCKVACIGCNRCTKVYETDTINVNNFLCYINPEVDVEKYGPEIVGCCPTKAIIGVGVTGVKPKPKARPKPETTENKSGEEK